MTQYVPPHERVIAIFLLSVIAGVGFGVAASTISALVGAGVGIGVVALLLALSAIAAMHAS